VSGHQIAATISLEVKRKGEAVPNRGAGEHDRTGHLDWAFC
jgi:hypothetical protein